MRTVRIVDRGSALQHGLVPTATGTPSHKDLGKPSVDEKRAYYWSGPGWVAAYNEARRLMDSGLPAEKAAPQVGWTKEELEAAIRRGGMPPAPPPAGSADDFKPRERPRRTVKQRVAGLHGVSKETQDLARRYYETEVMTVREVAKALGEPYEKTYLILILAKTKFRRPGRRGADARSVSRPPGVRFDVRPQKVTPALTTPDDIVSPNEDSRRKIVPEDGKFKTVHKRRRRGAVKKEAKKRIGSRKKATEREKALRRVLGA